MQIFQSAKKDPKILRGNLFGLISKEIELVEEEFRVNAASNIQVIDFLGDYLRGSGGKRIRPSLLILANKAAGADGASDSTIRMATVMEMLHT
ncbi:MAG: polyprenyl synthetase family protein, partial [Acidobacteriota bacterium]|nr:polyprenyl synthetase family protein [Acidobacteriota bacterium]